jgi:hypothetical protein
VPRGRTPPRLAAGVGAVTRRSLSTVDTRKKFATGCCEGFCIFLLLNGRGPVRKIRERTGAGLAEAFSKVPTPEMRKRWTDYEGPPSTVNLWGSRT